MCPIYILQNTGWLQFFMELPDGINQVLIDGYVHESGSHNIVILDDVTIQSCEHLSEYDPRLACTNVHIGLISKNIDKGINWIHIIIWGLWWQKRVKGMDE